MCPPLPLTSMLRTSSLTDSSAGATQIVVEYDGVDDGGGCSGDSNRNVHPTSINVPSKGSARSTWYHLLEAQDELINGLIN